MGWRRLTAFHSQGVITRGEGDLEAKGEREKKWICKTCQENKLIYKENASAYAKPEGLAWTPLRKIIVSIC